MTTESKYLLFREVEVPGLKTKVWNVISKNHGDVLGQIKWYGPWRCYTFRPSTGTIWNLQCLVDVGSFIVEQMTAWQNSRRGAISV